MNIHIPSKLKDIGLLNNAFHLYGWMDDNREMCQRHGAPDKIKMDCSRRNDESVLLESYVDNVSPRNNSAYFSKDNNEFIWNDDADSTSSEQLEIHFSATRSYSCSPSKSCLISRESKSLTSSEIDDLLHKVVELQSLLVAKGAENKKISDKNSLLVDECEQLKRDKSILEGYTKRKLSNSRDSHFLAVQEYKFQLRKRQEKINATLAEKAELQTLLAEQKAEKKKISYENGILEDECRKLRGDKNTLEGYTEIYKLQLRKRQDKINTTMDENAELRNLLARKEHEIKEITTENNILKAKHRMMRSEDEIPEAYTRGGKAKNKVKHLGILQECDVKVRQKQDKQYALDRRNRTELSNSYATPSIRSEK